MSVIFKANIAMNAQTIIMGSLNALVSSFSDIFVLLSNSKIIYNCKFLSLKDCDCDKHGSASAICEKEGDNKGKCTCKDLYDGQICNKCKDGYYGFSQPSEIPDCQRKYYRPFTIEL